MDWLHTVLNWCTGGADHRYMPLTHCLDHDAVWIGITVVLNLAVAAGYVVIAFHWLANERLVPKSPVRTTLATMRNIFILCGTCGYLFIPVKLLWPGWRLYDIVMLGLVFYTWRYALRARDLRVVYTAIGQSSQLAADLAKSVEESKRKSFFLNAVSHDLRTPLNGLLLQTDLAALHLSADDTVGIAESLAEIKAGIRLTANLLDGLLEYARLESGDDVLHVDPFNLDELVRDCLQLHAGLAARKRLDWPTDVRTGITLKTDRLKVQRVLNNLLDNAIKFTDRGSVRLNIERSATGVDIHVIDTGRGIAAEDQQKLFDEFFQVENYERDRQKGFGLGLCIAQRLCRQLGGQLRFASEVGHGSRFTVVLTDFVPPVGGPPTDPSVHPDTGFLVGSTPRAGG